MCRSKGARSQRGADQRTRRQVEKRWRMKLPAHTLKNMGTHQVADASPVGQLRTAHEVAACPERWIFDVFGRGPWFVTSEFRTN